MQEFWEKVKLFFKDKLNTAIVVLVSLFLIMVALPIDNEIYARISMFVLAIALVMVAYKFYKKHMEMRNVYDNLDSVRQEKRESSFSQLKGRVEKSNRMNNLVYAIVFVAMALLIIFYVIFK